MKNFLHNQEFSLNEIVFEHRNKEYGAYALRNDADRMLTKALFIGLGILAAASITPIVISSFRNSVTITDMAPHTLPPMKDVDERVYQPPAVQPTQPVAPAQSVKQYDRTVPEPTRDAVEPAKKIIPKDAIAGTTDDFTAVPAKTNTYVPTTPQINNGSPQIVTQPIIIKTDFTKIENALSVEAKYEGGIDAFRNKVASNFDNSGFEEGTMKTMVTFIVERDGSISGIKADGKDANFNDEAIRTIKSIRGKWVPGKNKDGEFVRSYFKFPISMNFNN
ncbi:energy transducer TonB [Chryseobacterium sp.]|uniref:energy transducer TonB n=1 Tax=Chryseobacterium sp. TaxID=1871047 RepID=UPI00388E9B61